LDNELVITTWSPIHLRSKLKELYWKADKAVKEADFWEDTLRYLYMPRLRDRGVLAQAIVVHGTSAKLCHLSRGLFQRLHCIADSRIPKNDL
jgi:predicted AAA+ superfamily ATPase